MSESKSPFDRVFGFVLGIIFACLLVQFAVAIVMQALASAWKATFGQPAIGWLAPILFSLLGVLVLAGIAVRVGQGLQGFWHSLLESFHGPRRDRGRRTRGVEHAEPERPRRQRPARHGDPHVPLEHREE